MSNDTFAAAEQRSNKLFNAIMNKPGDFRVLTGDRPTGPLHVGHLFGSLEYRIMLQDIGVSTFIVIADYQVLTDRDSCDAIRANVRELVLDYLAVGLDKAVIFPHSHVPELNQLLVPFLTLVSQAELARNPTVKEEIDAAGLSQVNAGMYVYPVHQAADILACRGTVVPVGKDQLPHLELSRTIARRFNTRFGQKVFAEPEPLLSASPSILGLDGRSKMSKSRGNAIFLSASEDETARLVKKAVTDSERLITYEPLRRPQVANLLKLITCCTGRAPEAVAAEIGDGGAGRLKEMLTIALNERLEGVRDRRKRLAAEPGLVEQILADGIARARDVASDTLAAVRQAMNMAL